MHTRKHKRPSIRDFFTNLSAPRPLSEKIRLLLRNHAIKLKNRQDCCGHPGGVRLLTEGRRELIRGMRGEVKEFLKLHRYGTTIGYSQ